jgi:hypothetical protein
VPTVASFLIVSPHEPDEHQRALEETLGQGPQFQEAFHWGCVVGDHVGYAFVRARSAGEAVEDYVPAFLRARASARRVEKIKARDLRPRPPGEA